MIQGDMCHCPGGRTRYGSRVLNPGGFINSDTTTGGIWSEWAAAGQNSAGTNCSRASHDYAAPAYTEQDSWIGECQCQSVRLVNLTAAEPVCIDPEPSPVCHSELRSPLSPYGARSIPLRFGTAADIAGGGPECFDDPARGSFEVDLRGACVIKAASLVYQWIPFDLFPAE